MLTYIPVSFCFLSKKRFRLGLKIGLGLGWVLGLGLGVFGFGIGNLIGGAVGKVGCALARRLCQMLCNREVDYLCDWIYITFKFSVFLYCCCSVYFIHLLIADSIWYVCCKLLAVRIWGELLCKVTWFSVMQNDAVKAISPMNTSMLVLVMCLIKTVVVVVAGG